MENGGVGFFVHLRINTAWCVLCHRGYRREAGHCHALAAGAKGGWPWGCSRATAALPGLGVVGGQFATIAFPPFTYNLGCELKGYLAEAD